MFQPISGGWKENAWWNLIFLLNNIIWNDSNVIYYDNKRTLLMPIKVHIYLIGAHRTQYLLISDPYTSSPSGLIMTTRLLNVPEEFMMHSCQITGTDVTQHGLWLFFSYVISFFHLQNIMCVHIYWKSLIIHVLKSSHFFFLHEGSRWKI